MKMSDLYWLAGLLEGEGAFMYSKASPEVSLQMVDRDVVARAAGMFGVPLRAPYTPRGEGYRPVWCVRVHGCRAIQWMQTLYVLLGERRQARVREILAKWRVTNYMPRAPRGERFMAICHPNRVRAGHGLCDGCYMYHWRRKPKGVKMRDYLGRQGVATL